MENSAKHLIHDVYTHIPAYFFASEIMSISAMYLHILLINC